MSLEFSEGKFPDQYLPKAEELIGQIGYLSSQLLDLAGEIGTDNIDLCSGHVCVTIRRPTGQEKEDHERLEG